MLASIKDNVDRKGASVHTLRDLPNPENAVQSIEAELYQQCILMYTAGNIRHFHVLEIQL